MISREPTLERLAIAQQLLIEPFGLDESKLAAALGVIAEHRIDDADLYFQITRHEGWSLEEGIVKSGSFGIDQGVGVRAVAGEKTAFAYSDDISEAALMDAAHTVRTIAASGQSRRVKVGGPTPKIARTERPGFLSIHAQPAAGGRQRARQRVQQRGLARTRGTDHDHLLARFDAQIETGERGCRTLAGGGVPHGNLVEREGQPGHYLIRPALRPAASRPL